MDRFRSIALSFALMLIGSSTLQAQFYTSGTDPGHTRWSTVSTRNWQLIYPRGLDSLARCYAVQLERSANAVGGSLGYSANQMYVKPMPVVLHTGVGYNNGMVTWAPRRMDLYCTPDPYDPSSIPTVSELSIHEGRHVAQMQIGGIKAYRPFNLLIGEMTTGALAALYGGPAFLEGDAVATETALTSGGRGREADFLEYIRACFDEGDMRDWWRWRYGSQRLYTPDHYRSGYMMQAGMRTLMGAPDFTARLYSGIEEKKGWSFFNYDRVAREISGSRTAGAFAQISDTLAGIWSSEADARRPWTPTRQLTGERRFFTEFTGTTLAGGQLYSIRKGLDLTPEIVRIDSLGKVTRMHSIGSMSSRLKADEQGRLWWSEYRRDPRWDLGGLSVICMMTPDGKVRTIAHGHRYYNPAPCGDKVAVAEYLQDGSCAFVILNAADGRVLGSRRLPDGFQLVDCTWLDGKAYGSCVTEQGIGIYRLADMTPCLTPCHSKIKQLDSEGGLLCFVSDRGGSDEVYTLKPSDGSLEQLTSSRIGSSEYAFCGTAMAVSQLRRDGRMIHLIQRDSLLARKVDKETSYSYPMADELSAGEPLPIGTEDVKVSEPEAYSRFRHLIRVHSWLPVWYDYDAGAAISMENLFTSANLGATAFSQNTLGTLYGFAGVSLLNGDLTEFRPAGHLSLTWEGWYPVIEARLDVGERTRRGTQVIRMPSKDGKGSVSKARNFDTDVPLVSGSISAYVPLYFNGNGWRRGIIPQISANFSNDLFGIEVQKVDKEEDASLGNAVPRVRAIASLRTYAMLPTAQSAIYPRWGIGLNLGLVTRPGLSGIFGNDMYKDKYYFQLYGYLPGLTRRQGLKWSVLHQEDLGSGTGVVREQYASMMPRGIGGYKAGITAATNSPSGTKFTLDYGIPFASVDWGGLGPLAYVRNFELIPHLDFTGMKTRVSGNYPTYCFCSVGTTLDVVLGNLWCIPFETRIGVSCSCNTAFDAQSRKPLQEIPDKFSASLVFSVDM